MTAKPLLCTAILAGTMLCVNDAHGERPSYMGAHAIPESRDGVFCYIELAHTHTYPPDATLLAQFVQHEHSNARYEFIGDPEDFDFQGLSFPYFGAHPIDFASNVAAKVSAEDTQCTRPGQHAHLRDPANPERYEERDGVYYFESYRKARRADRKARRSKRPSRTARRSAKRTGKQSELRQAPARVPAASTPTKPTATAKNARPDAHRSWMKRRLGR